VSLCVLKNQKWVLHLFAFFIVTQSSSLKYYWVLRKCVNFSYVVYTGGMLICAYLHLNKVQIILSGREKYKAN